MAKEKEKKNRLVPGSIGWILHYDTIHGPDPIDHKQDEEAPQDEDKHPDYIKNRKATLDGEK